MKVLLASPRGFCAGVNMAIDALDLALRTLPPPVYVYHEIVHNKHVVGHFRDRGVVFVDSPDEAPPGSTLAFLRPRRLARDPPAGERTRPYGRSTPPARW